MTMLSTLYIGPDGRGRDFRIRGESSVAEAAVPAGELVRGLPLVLARWAEAGERDVVACLPLPGGDAVVLRARNTGRLESGYGCYANAVIVPAAWAQTAERSYFDVLAAIPEPGATDRFARQALDADTLAQSSVGGHAWSGLGVRWNRRCVITDGVAEPEAVLGSILAGLKSATDLPFTGWATSISWSSLYGPEGDIRLLVVPPAYEAQVPAEFEIARMTPAGFEGATFDLPLPVQIRNRFIAQLEPGARGQAATTIARWPPGKAGSLTEQLFEVAKGLIAPLDYEVGLAQSLRFATIPATEFDGFFAALSRRLFRWFLEQDRHKGRLGTTLAFLDAPAAVTVRAAIGPLAGYVLDSQKLCGELDRGALNSLEARHDFMAVLKARRDLATVLTWFRPDITLAIFDTLLSGDLSADTAEGMAQAARTVFARSDVGGFAALLRQHLVPSSLSKTGLLIELVMLIYDSDMPRKARHG